MKRKLLYWIKSKDSLKNWESLFKKRETKIFHSEEKLTGFSRQGLWAFQIDKNQHKALVYTQP